MTAQDSNFANAYEGTLTVAFGPTDLTCVVDTTSGAPASPCYLCIEATNGSRREYVFFDDTFTGTTLVTTDVANRYLAGSAAGSGLTHPVGSKVRSVPAAQMFEDLHDRIDGAVLKSLIDAAGDLIYGTGADTAARLAAGTARQQLAMNALATAPEWVASLQSLLTTIGDIPYASAANTPARLAAGTSGYVLTSGGAGVAPSWAASASGALTQIATSTLGADAASIDFTSIPSTYNHLRLVIQARSTRASQADSFIIRFNNDASTNYDWIEDLLNNTTYAGQVVNADSSAKGGTIAAASAASGLTGIATIDIPNYKATAFEKALVSIGTAKSGTSASNFFTGRYGGHWRSTAAISRITLLPTVGPNFLAGTTATLYGVT